MKSGPFQHVCPYFHLIDGACREFFGVQGIKHFNDIAVFLAKSV